jgi:hypothetical protein
MDVSTTKGLLSFHTLTQFKVLDIGREMRWREVARLRVIVVLKGVRYSGRKEGQKDHGMLPVYESRDLVIVSDEDVVWLQVGMAKDGKAELRNVRYEVSNKL